MAGLVLVDLLVSERACGYIMLNRVATSSILNELTNSDDASLRVNLFAEINELYLIVFVI